MLRQISNRIRLTQLKPLFVQWGVPMGVAVMCFAGAAWLRQSAQSPTFRVATPADIHLIRVQTNRPDTTYTIRLQPTLSASPQSVFPLDPDKVSAWVSRLSSFPVTRRQTGSPAIGQPHATITLSGRFGHRYIRIGESRPDMQTMVQLNDTEWMLVPTGLVYDWTPPLFSLQHRQLYRNSGIQYAQSVSIRVTPPGSFGATSMLTLTQLPVTGWWVSNTGMIDPDRVLGVLRLIESSTIGEVRTAVQSWDATLTLAINDTRITYGVQYPTAIFQQLSASEWGSVVPIMGNMMGQLLQQTPPEYPLQLVHTQRITGLSIQTPRYTHRFHRNESGHFMQGTTRYTQLVQSFFDQLGQLRVASPSNLANTPPLHITFATPTQSQRISIRPAHQGRWQIAVNDRVMIWVQSDQDAFERVLNRLTVSHSSDYNSKP